MAWTLKLKTPLALKDGRRLATLRDAADLILALPKRHQDNAHWTHAATLMLAAAGDKSALPEAERQLTVALRAEGLV